MRKEVRTVTTDLSGTYELGKRIGKNLKGDETFALVADLGGGKTTLTQGLAQGLGAKERVTSPTFVLEKIYSVPKKDWALHHFDLYRIEAVDIDTIGLMDVLGENVVVIEWAKKIKKQLPDDTIWVEIRYQSENVRGFIFNFPEEKKYVFKDIKSCDCF